VAAFGDGPRLSGSTGGAVGVGALGVAPAATALGGVMLALERGAAAVLSPRPWLSIQAPETASPMSISRTRRMSRQGRRAVIGIDSAGSSSGARGRGGCTTSPDRLGGGGAYPAGAALLIARGGGALGAGGAGGSAGGFIAWCAGGAGRDPAPGGIAPGLPLLPPPGIGRCGKLASSEIF
jgi:hypothetical protein